jgi:chromosome segregation ATPase
MTDVETLAERVSTVERAVTDGECEFPEATELSDVEGRLAAVEDRLDELGERVDELDAATQAVRGYVGNVRSVNEDVEQRADTALAATERLERRLDEIAAGRRSDGPQHSSGADERRSDHGPRRADDPIERHTGHEPRGDGFGQAESDTDDETDTTPDAGVVERIRSLL